MNKLPAARVEDIVVQEIGKETLIYDLNTNKAYNLNETCSIVYKSCDGRTTFSQLKAQSKFTDDIIYLALDELRKDNLIETSDSFNSPFAGMNRREVIRKVGLSSMIALPLILSLVAPTAVMAQSGKKASCASCTSDASDAECTSNNCVSAASGGGFICSAGTSTTAAGRPGEPLTANGSQADCTTSAQQFCCRGTATFVAAPFPGSNTCTCN